MSERRKKVAQWVAVTLVGFGLLHVLYVVLGPKLVFLVMQAFVAAGATTFSIVYHVTATWWKSAMGRNIMLLVGSIAAILDLSLAFTLAGRPDWMREIFAALYAAIGVAIWRRLTILIDAQHHADWTAHRNRDKPAA